MSSSQIFTASDFVDLTQPPSARFSECGKYRFVLTREFDRFLEVSIEPSAVRELSGTLVSIGANPSIAGADINDPTIRKEMGYAKRWGYRRLVKLNAYAIVATDPKHMHHLEKQGVDVIGADNDRTLHTELAAARACGAKIWANWGTNVAPDRVAQLVAMFADLRLEVFCIGKTKEGHPKHPLYTSYEKVKLERWWPR